MRGGRGGQEAASKSAHARRIMTHATDNLISCGSHAGTGPLQLTHTGGKNSSGRSEGRGGGGGLLYNH